MDRFLNIKKLKEFFVENTGAEKDEDQTIEECFDENFNLDAILEEVVEISMINGDAEIEIPDYNSKNGHVESICADRTDIIYLSSGKILANPVLTDEYYDITGTGVVIGIDKFGDECILLPEKLELDGNQFDDLLTEIENETDSIEYVFSF